MTKWPETRRCPDSHTAAARLLRLRECAGRRACRAYLVQRLERPATLTRTRLHLGNSGRVWIRMGCCGYVARRQWKRRFGRQPGLCLVQRLPIRQFRAPLTGLCSPAHRPQLEMPSPSKRLQWRCPSEYRLCSETRSRNDNYAGIRALAFKASRRIAVVYESAKIRNDGSRFPAIVPPGRTVSGKCDTKVRCSTQRLKFP